MNRTVIAVIVTGALLASGSAWAKDYGDAGTIELGGSFSLLSNTTKLEDDEGPTTSKSDETSTNINIGPSVSYYLLGGVPLIAEVGIEMINEKDNENDETSSDQYMRIGVGSGFLMKVGAARIGPAGIVEYITGTSKFEDEDGESERTLTAQRVTAGGIAKLPIGKGGVITAALFAQYGMGQEEVKDAPGDPTELTYVGFGTSLGVSVWF